MSIAPTRETQEAFRAGIETARAESAAEIAALGERLEGISKECNYLRGQEKYWQDKAKQYEEWFEETLNKYHAAQAELRQYTEPDAVIIELRRELANANRWIEEYRVENRKLRGER